MGKQNRMPAIRFRGFVDPWEQRKLGDITVKIGSGKTPSGGKNAYVETGIPLIRSQNVNGDKVDFEDVVYIDEATDESMANSRVFTNDVLLNITGASIGRSAVYKGLEQANVNQHVCIIRPIEEFHPDFIQLNLTSDNGQKQIEASQAGGGREGLNFQEIGKMEFSFPQIDEQRKIGTYFNSIDHLITLHQRKYDKLVAIKKAMLEKMFPREGSRFPEIRFAGFAEPWERRKLGDIVDVCSGMDYKHLSEGNIPVYGTGGYMLSVNKALSYDRDAIGIGRKGTIDKPYILRAPFWTVDTLFYALPKDADNLDFAFDLFQTIDWRKKDESTGVPSLSKVAINETEVMTPSNRDEQSAIGNFFSALDKTITLHQRKLEKLQAIKKSMLEKMFA